MYLSAQEYLDRFGEAEATRLTDEDRSGLYDSEKLEEAIRDSSDEVDSYIGKRYGTPLLSPPRLVKGMVAVLARERLHKTKAPESVRDEAERARSQLRDIARGLMILPSETGPVAEDARAPATSASSGDGATPIFTEQALAGFGVGDLGRVANWRR